MTYSFTRTGPEIEAIHDTVTDPSSNLDFTNAIGEVVIPKYSTLKFESVSNAISEIVSKDYPEGSSLIVEDYYGGLNPNNSGVLFFKVVAAGTGVDDGGKYIDIDATRQLEQNLKKPYSVKAWGAKTDGTDTTSQIQTALNYSASNLGLCLLDPGSYTTSSPIIIPNGGAISGVKGTKSRKLSKIINSSSSAFTTDSSLNGFAGIYIGEVRISGGATGEFAITSHYPRTIIDGVLIEDSPTAYAGNGIRLHNDGGQGGMGCWSSEILNSTITLDDEDSNRRVTLDLFINGGDVLVHNVDMLKSNEAVNVRNCQAIRFSDCNINKIYDTLSTSSSIESAAIVLGSSTPSANETVFDVESCSFSNCYIEGYSRAALIRNATNTSFSDCFFNDIQYRDPNADSINQDGTFYMTSLASGLSIDNCFIKNGYSFQRLVYKEDKANEYFLGLTIKNTKFYYMNYRQFGGTSLFNTSEDYYLNNFSHTWTLSDGTTRESKLYVRSPASLQDEQLFVRGDWQDVGEILDGETWFVTASVSGNGINNVYMGYAYQNEGAGVAYPVNTPDRIDVRVNSGMIQIQQNDQFGNDKNVKWSINRVSKFI